MIPCGVHLRNAAKWSNRWGPPLSVLRCGTVLTPGPLGFECQEPVNDLQSLCQETELDRETYASFIEKHVGGNFSPERGTHLRTVRIVPEWLSITEEDLVEDRRSMERASRTVF